MRPMFLVLAFIWAFAMAAGISTVAVLVWAIKKGEFRDLRAGARSIFDENEPIGLVTDNFPGEGPTPYGVAPSRFLAQRKHL
jgi:nitrogen fixation-related uncharacterized protein